MASRIVLAVVIVVLLAVTGYFVTNYKIEPHYENGKFVYAMIIPRGSTVEPTNVPLPNSNPNLPPPPAGRTAFSLASFNAGGLDETKLSNPRTANVLVKVLPRFELVALQGIRGKNRNVLTRLVDQIKTTSGKQFDFATCPTQQRDGIEHYSAFLFDKAAIDIDRSTVRFIEDPQRKFRHKPLIGSFRVRGPKATEAFTFTLVTVETNPDKPSEELDLLAEVFRAVRNDGRNEDDVIVLGDFQADENHLGRLGKILDITTVITDKPTTTRGTKLTDNFLFDRRATAEFTGRSGVVDLMREFDLPNQVAIQISEHLPIWAEFSVLEGGPHGILPRHEVPPNSPMPN